jgi:hypothetical protein
VVSSFSFPRSFLTLLLKKWPLRERRMLARALYRLLHIVAIIIQSKRN